MSRQAEPNEAKVMKSTLRRAHKSRAKAKGTVQLWHACPKPPALLSPAELAIVTAAAHEPLRKKQLVAGSLAAWTRASILSSQSGEHMHTFIQAIALAAFISASSVASFAEWNKTIDCPAGRAYREVREYAGREEFCERLLPGSLKVKDGPYRSWFSEGHPGEEGSYHNGRQVGAPGGNAIASIIADNGSIRLLAIARSSERLSGLTYLFHMQMAGMSSTLPHAEAIGSHAWMGNPFWISTYMA